MNRDPWKIVGKNNSKMKIKPRRTTAELEVLALIAPLGKLIVTH